MSLPLLAVVQENEDSIIAFLRNLKKKVRFAPVFIFTDEPVDTIIEKLKQHKDLYDETDPSHILVRDKQGVFKTGLFNVLSEWTGVSPLSLRSETMGEGITRGAKNEMFLDFYAGMGPSGR